MFVRVFHYIMKIAMYVIPWGMPKVIEGEDSILQLPEVIYKNGNRRVLVVADPFLAKNGYLQPLLDKMSELQLSYVIFNEVDPNQPFHYHEFVKARDEYFSSIAHKSTRDWIERSTGIHMKPPAKRNGRSRQDHIARVNLKRKMEHETFGDAYAGGRPPKQAQVEEWQAAHPGGKKIDCHRDTGLSRSTIDKWWQ